MDEGTRTRSAALVDADSREAQQIRQQIEETRRELGETVASLAEKTDVKSRAKQKIDATKTTISQEKDHLLDRAKQTSPDTATRASARLGQKAQENPAPIAAAGAFAVGLIAGALARGKH